MGASASPLRSLRAKRFQGPMRGVPRGVSASVKRVIALFFLFAGCCTTVGAGGTSPAAVRHLTDQHQPVDPTLAAAAARAGLTTNVPALVTAACRELAARARRQGSSRPLYCPPLAPRARGYRIELAGGLNGYSNVRDSTVIAVKSPTAASASALGGHWTFAQGEPRVVVGAYVPAEPGRVVRRARLGGRPVTIYRMPETQGFYGGHVVIEWLQQATAFQVSMHGQANFVPTALIARALMREIALCPLERLRASRTAACRLSFYG